MQPRQLPYGLKKITFGQWEEKYLQRVKYNLHDIKRLIRVKVVYFRTLLSFVILADFLLTKRTEISITFSLEGYSLIILSINTFLRRSR